MSTHALSPDCLAVVQALRPHLREAAEQGLRVRVGCSGGPDSLALAAGTALLARRDPALMAAALVVDHQLQEGSGQVAARTVELLGRLGLPARRVVVSVDPASPDGPEAAARDARYAALRAPDDDGQAPGMLLLGHTLDDQAETVLLGLVRGSGTRSLAGMAASSGTHPRLVRPLLGVRRAQTRQACADWGLRPWHDPQNEDLRYTRVAVRARIMPFLDAELGRDLALSLARTAELARADADLLDALAAAQGERVTRAPSSAGGLPELDCAALAPLPAALRGRIVRSWLTGCGLGAPDHAHTLAVLGLVTDWHGQKAAGLPGGAEVVRREGRLAIRRRPASDAACGAVGHVQ